MLSESLQSKSWPGGLEESEDDLWPCCLFIFFTRHRKDRRRPFIDWLCMMRGAERAYTEREGARKGV